MGGCILQRLHHRCCASPQGHPLFSEALPFPAASRKMCASHLAISQLTFFPMNRLWLVSVFVAVWVCSYSSWFSHLPCLCLLLFHFYCLGKSAGWKNRTEQNAMYWLLQSTNSHLHISAWPVFVFIHLQVFLIFLRFGLSKQSFAVVWLFGPFAQGCGRNFPDVVTYHKSWVVFRYGVKKVYFCSSPK